MANKPTPAELSILTHAEKDALILSMWDRLEALEAKLSMNSGSGVSS